MKTYSRICRSLSIVSLMAFGRHRRCAPAQDHLDIGAAHAQGFAGSRLWSSRTCSAPVCRRTRRSFESVEDLQGSRNRAHDFPLPMQQLVRISRSEWRRYFDDPSKGLGNEFRDYIFENQWNIKSAESARPMRKSGTRA